MNPNICNPWTSGKLVNELSFMDLQGTMPYPGDGPMNMLGVIQVIRV